MPGDRQRQLRFGPHAAARERLHHVISAFKFKYFESSHRPCRCSEAGLGSLPYSVLNRTRTKSRLCPSPQCKSGHGVIGVTLTKPTALYVTHFGTYFCAALIKKAVLPVPNFWTPQVWTPSPGPGQDSARKQKNGSLAEMEK